MIERLTLRNHPPEAPHPAARSPGGELAFEECFTQEGFEGPYTIAYHQRAPHTQRLTEAKHGWAPAGGRRRGTPARQAALQDAGDEAGRAARRWTRGRRCSSTPT